MNAKKIIKGIVKLGVVGGDRKSTRPNSSH